MKRHIFHGLLGCLFALILVSVFVTAPLCADNMKVARFVEEGEFLDNTMSCFNAIPIPATMCELPSPVVSVASRITGNPFSFSPCCFFQHTTSLQKQRWNICRKSLNVIAFTNVQADYYIFALHRIRI